MLTVGMLQILAPSVKFEAKAQDGDVVVKGTTLALLSGPSDQVRMQGCSVHAEGCRAASCAHPA